jgi:hypothetical protein
MTYQEMKEAAAPTLSSTPRRSTKANDTITLGYIKGPGSILIGVGNTSTLAVPSREQLYNCLDGNNVTLFLCKWVILPKRGIEPYLTTSEKNNQVYTTTINSYVYRPLGWVAPTGTTLPVLNITETITLPSSLTLNK